MAQRIKVTRTVQVTFTVDVDDYPGMTAEQAVEYERNMPENEAFESVTIALEDGDTQTKMTVDATVIDA